MTIVTRSTVVPVLDRLIQLQLPADPDAMLQEAVAGEASGDRHTDPYWGLLWDAAPATARRVLQHSWPAGATALELGCGIGLVGIAGRLAGLQVTFSDLVPSAVQLSLANARANGCDDCCGLVIDWQAPPALQFDVLLASDVLYDATNHQPLLNTLQVLLKPGGLVWIGDAGRANAPRFLQLARDAGWQVQLSDAEGRGLTAPTHVQFQLVQLTR